jgi:hypothetical protein
MRQARILATRGALIAGFEADRRTNVLEVITNPGIALLLMTIGVYGLVFEFMSPGYAAPDVIGAICLLLGLYALQLPPVNYAGLALIALGLVLMGLEAFLPSFGILGLGGMFAFVVGAMMLIDTELPGYGIPPVLIGVLAVASALLLTGTPALRCRRAGVHDFGFGLGALIILVLPLLAASIRVLREYERGVVFQLGRYRGVKRPGLIILIPVIQRMVRVDLRTIVHDVPTQDVISRDNVSVKVNAAPCARCWANMSWTRCWPNASA